MSTINDIAKMAGVSVSTVSHVVNKTRYVSPEKVAKVEKAIQEMDTPPNFILKKQRAGQRNISYENVKYILLLLSDKNSRLQYQMSCVLEVKMRAVGHTLVTLECGADPTQTEPFLQSVLERIQPIGVIVFPDEKDVLMGRVLKGVHMPVVVLGRKVNGYPADMLYPDTFDGAYRATRHLINKGHELVGFLGISRDRTPQRLEGFRQAFADSQLEVSGQYVYTHLSDEGDVAEALDQMLTGDHMPTAVMIANPSLVPYFFQYIDAHNIDCPDDVSVVCFDFSDWAILHKPALTTVEQDVDHYAQLAVDTLVNRMSYGEEAKRNTDVGDYKEIRLPMQMVVRDSTCGIGRGPFGEKAAGIHDVSVSEELYPYIKGKKATAVISFHYAGKAWMRLHLKGIREVFDKMGISIIAITDAHFDPELQCKQLDSLLSLEPDLFIAIPVDNKITSKAFEKIAASNSQLILITNVPEGLSIEDYVTCVSVNERSHGQNMGHGLGDYMERHGLCHYGIIRHGADFYATNQRDGAAMQVLDEEYASLHKCGEVVFYNEDEVYDKTKELLHRYPEIEALYISWDGPAMEAIAALTEIGRSDVIISTGDLDKPAALNMARGGMIKRLSAQCPYEQGQVIALAASKAIAGEKVPSFIGVEPIRVTPDNLLRSWKKVFKEEPDPEIVSAFKDNPNYISEE